MWQERSLSGCAFLHVRRPRETASDIFYPSDNQTGLIKASNSRCCRPRSDRRELADPLVLKTYLYLVQESNNLLPVRI